MALSLNAEQKSIHKVFNIDEQYIIPEFQRPYSWDYEQCFQLYMDLVTAFESKEDYFVGNIILAVGRESSKMLEVIDGQQRLTTFFLIIKVIATLEDNEHIRKYLTSINWKGEAKVRLESKIIETDDPNNLKKVLEYGLDNFDKKLEAKIGKNGIVDAKKCENNFEQNILCFYQWLKKFREENKDLFNNFVDYLLEKVYLLPIQLNGATLEDARQKALVIFETVNNRGMSLEDADIFKAQLYKGAAQENQQQVFIDEWKNFRTKCDDLGLQIDDVFRYYSHIIRGKEGVTSNEINMREFFMKKEYSPFNNKNYREILSDLFKILATIEFFNSQKRKATSLAKWLQLIDYYSNQYPKWALTCYLFVNEIHTDEQNIIQFCKRLIRYVYAKGATTTIKHEMYNIIKQVCQGAQIKDYIQSFTVDDFYPLGRLKYGYGLLAFYLRRDVALPNYYMGRIYNTKDVSYVKEDVEGWEDKEVVDILDNVANFIVTDIPQRNAFFRKKKTYFVERSSLSEIQQLFDNEYTYELFERREEQLLNILLEFFNSHS